MASKKNATVTTKKITSRMEKSPSPVAPAPHSEFNEYGQIKPVLVFYQIWSKTWHHRPRSAGVATQRRDATRPGEIRDIRRPVIELPAERNVLAGHVIECAGHIPCLVRITGILGEVRRSRSSGCTVDRWQQH